MGRLGGVGIWLNGSPVISPSDTFNFRSCCCSGLRAPLKGQALEEAIWNDGWLFSAKGQLAVWVLWPGGRPTVAVLTDRKQVSWGKLGVTWSSKSLVARRSLVRWCILRRRKEQSLNDSRKGQSLISADCATVKRVKVQMQLQSVSHWSITVTCTVIINASRNEQCSLWCGDSSSDD